LKKKADYMLWHVRRVVTVTMTNKWCYCSKLYCATWFSCFFAIAVLCKVAGIRLGRGLRKRFR